MAKLAHLSERQRESTFRTDVFDYTLAYLFFASNADSSFITGQVLPIPGGTLP